MKLLCIPMFLCLFNCSGPAGSDGARGIPGTSGTEGDAGINGLNGINGGMGPQGKAGINGTDGVNGAAGTNGATGAAGVNGTNGTDNHITNSIFCTGTIQSTTLAFSYTADVLASGDVLANASIQGTSLQVSGSAFYASTQVGALTAVVQMTLDSFGASDSGWWTISTDRTTHITTLIYHDTDMTPPTTTWTMQPSQCVVNTY